MRGRRLFSFGRNKRRGKARAAPLLFSSGLQLTGPSLLPRDITINGQTVSPTFRYEAKDIEGTTWHAVVGEDLTASAAADIVPTPFTDGALATVGNGLYSGSNSQGDIDKQNFVLECVVFHTQSTVNLARRKASTASSAPGWIFYIHGNGTPYLRVTDDLENDQSLHNSTDRLTVGAYNHVVMAFEHGNVIRRYINGVRTSDVEIPQIVGSLSTPASFRMLESLGLRLPYLSMWDGALDFTGLDSEVANRFAQLTGIYPQLAKGTPDPTYTRATGATLDITDDEGVTRLFSVPPGWPRICQRPDADGILRRGYLSERQATNLVLHSNDLTQAVWTKSNAVIVAGTPGPLGELAGIASTGANPFVSQTLSLTGTTHTLSLVAKAGVDDVVTCDIGGAHSASFDLSSGTVAATNNATASIRDWGEGRYRCEVTFTAAAGSAAVALGSLLGGDGVTPNIYLGLVQLETGQMATSHIPTTGSAATRNGDVLSYKGDDGNAAFAEGTIGSTMLAPNRGDTAMSGFSWWYALSMFRQADSAHIATRGNNHQLRFVVDANTTNTVLDQYDGKEHRVGMSYASGDVSRFHNGPFGEPVDWPTPDGAPDVVTVGVLYSGIAQPNGLLSNVRIWNKKVAP